MACNSPIGAAAGIHSRHISAHGLTNVPVAAAGTNVTVGDNAPTADHWNMAAVELPGDGA